MGEVIRGVQLRQVEPTDPVQRHLAKAEMGINVLDTDVIALLSSNPEVLIDTLKHLFMAIAELDKKKP